MVEPRKDSGGGRPPDAGGTEHALRAIEEQLERASAAAERVIAEATGGSDGGGGSGGAAAGGGGGSGGAAGDVGARADAKAPAAGWQSTGAGEGVTPGAELESLARALVSVRELIPPDVQRRLAEAVREVLLAVRALIDWYLERLERGRQEPSEVQDIPIL